MNASTVLSAVWFMFSCSCVSLAEAAPVECHADKNYLVAVKPFEDEPGARFAVTRLGGKKAPAKCAFSEKRADYVIGGKGDALWYGDRAGRFLILTRSTGPQGDLVVYDLDTGKPVLDVPSDEYAVKGGRIEFWQREGEATAQTCPTFAENQANGMGSVVSQRKLFDLATAEVSDTGDQRCDATQ